MDLRLYWVKEHPKTKKLFLCTEDIEIGDKVLDECREQIFIAEEGWEKKHDSDCCYKIIKPISKEATWVRNGMTFEENEIQPFNTLINIPIDIKYMSDDQVDCIQIYNEACGHFH
jgi:hypothetical protein